MVGGYTSKYEVKHQKLQQLRKRYFTLLSKKENVIGEEKAVRELQKKILETMREDKFFRHEVCPIYQTANIKINRICFACQLNNCPIFTKVDNIIKMSEGTYLQDIAPKFSEPAPEEEPIVKNEDPAQPMTERDKILKYRSLNTNLMRQCSNILEDVMSAMTLLNSSLAANVQEEINMYDPDYIFCKFK